MDGQLEAVRQDIRSVKDEIVEVKQELAIAKQAENKEKEKLLFELLLSLNNQLSGLHEKENILLRSQAQSKPYLQLERTSLPVFTSCCAPFSEQKVATSKLLCISEAFIVAQAFLLTVVLSGTCETLKRFLCMQASIAPQRNEAHFVLEYKALRPWYMLQSQQCVPTHNRHTQPGSQILGRLPE